MEDDELATPKCPRCLVPMETSGEGKEVAWTCPECGLIKLS